MNRITVTPEEQLKELKRGAFEIVPEEELLKKLKKSYEKQKPLVIKFGADPSRPDIHLGHAVVLRKLRKFQDIGCKVVFLIGDYTAQIGDPTGKSATRKPLTHQQVLQNATLYKEQASRVLDFSGENAAEIVFNSKGLDDLTLKDLIGIGSYITAPRLLERDMFQERLARGGSITFTEFMYPVMQGYDSVAIRADVEIGGYDQLFNLKASPFSPKPKLRASVIKKASSQLP